MYEKWLRSFHFVAKLGGFTRAAEHLGLSQPTVTQQVLALEEHFSVELFVRRARSVEMTHTGRTLYDITHEIFSLSDEAVGYLEALKHKRTGQFSIGTVGPAATMELVKRFVGVSPDISLSVDVGTTDLIERGLYDYSFDVVVLAKQLSDPECHSAHLGTFDVGLFVHHDHAWAGREAVDVGELEGQRVVIREESSSTQHAVERALERHGVTLGTVVRVSSREGVREAVLRNIGVGVVCEVDFVPGDDLRFLRVRSEDMNIGFYLTCLTRRRNRPLIRQVFEFVESS